MRVEELMDRPVDRGQAPAAPASSSTARLVMDVPEDGVLTEARDFALPQRLLATHPQRCARMRLRAKPQFYHPISRNRYVSRARMYGESPACQCDPKSGTCEEGCMNRMMQIVCSPRTCPCGARCTNGSLGKRPTPTLQVAYVRRLVLTQYGKRGFGLYTPERVHKGAFLGEYCGELIDIPEAARRVHDYYQHTQNYYLVDYDAWAGELLDAGLRGNKIRFVNHSCEPNCKIEKWLVSGSEQDHNAEFQLGLFALRDIEAGEELSYNYGWSAFKAAVVACDGEVVGTEKCYCGAPSCTGVLGRSKSRGKAQAPLAMLPPHDAALALSPRPTPPKRPRGRPRKSSGKTPMASPAQPSHTEALAGPEHTSYRTNSIHEPHAALRPRDRPHKEVREAPQDTPPRASASPTVRRSHRTPRTSAKADAAHSGPPPAAPAPPTTPVVPRKRGRPRKDLLPGSAPAAVPLSRQDAAPRADAAVCAAPPASAPSTPRAAASSLDPLTLPVGVHFTLTPAQIESIAAHARRRGRPRTRPLFRATEAVRWRRASREADEDAVQALLLTPRASTS